MSATLAELRAALPGAPRPAPAALRMGLGAVDDHLPGGGFGAGTHEVWPGPGGAPSEAAAALFAAHALASGSGPVIWALRRRDLFAPALAEAGLAPARVIYAEAGDEASVLAVTEEALRHGGLAGVVAETAKLSLKASRRLQLAAEATGTACFVLRRPRPHQTRSGQPESAGTACLTRWRITSAPSRAANGLPRASWRAELTRCRGGQPRAWNLEVDDGASPHRLRLAEAVAAGAAVADARRRAA